MYSWTLALFRSLMATMQAFLVFLYLSLCLVELGSLETVSTRPERTAAAEGFKSTRYSSQKRFSISESSTLGLVMRHLWYYTIKNPLGSPVY